MMMIAAASFAAVEPADSQIKGALGDIARFEQQATGLTSSRASNIKRTLKLMKLTRQRLDSSPNQSHPSWQEADRRYKALEASLQSLLAGGSAPKQATTNAAGSSTAASAASGAAATQPSAAKQTSEGRQLVSGQRVQVKKLARDITHSKNDIVTTGPSPMQDSRVVGQYNKRLKRYADALSRYKGYAKDPDIGAAVGAYQALVSAVKQEYERAKAQLAKVGNAQARLAAANQKLRDHAPPGNLLVPFTDDQARQWANSLAATRKAASEVVSEVQAITPIAYLPEDAQYSLQKANSLMRYAQDTLRKLNESVVAGANQLKHGFTFAEKHEMPFLRDLDPNDEHQKANLFLSEGAEANVYSRIDKQRVNTESYAAFYKAFDKPVPAEITTRLDELAQIRKTYSANRVKALGASKLPSPKSTDASLLAAAKAILANPDYKFGKHGPIVLTTEEIVTREKEVSRETIKEVDFSLSGTITMKGTRETWNYKWDEFKFATPLQHEDGSWYIWWITAKKYESGWERTPLGRWVSGQSTQGSLILKENF
ncbi:MAG: hypothetical protein AB8C46_12955 [Burkholderiaceae bacterium]